MSLNHEAAPAEGSGFTPHPERPHALLIGEAAGIAPMIALAEHLRGENAADPGVARYRPLVLLGSDASFPFRPRPSAIVVAGIPEGAIACMPLLDAWGIASRLASRADLPGCFDGSVTELAHKWLQELTPRSLAEVQIFASGPTPMLEATAALATRFTVPAQVLLC